MDVQHRHNVHTVYAQPDSLVTSNVNSHMSEGGR